MFRPTSAALGHCAMPVLWGEQMLGWANMKVVDGRLQHELGFAGLRPRGSAFRRALDEALHQMQEFLELRQRPEKGFRRMPSAVASR
jgi:uncharacterized protein